MNELEETCVKPHEKNYFGDWIKSIAVGDYKPVRKKIIEDCKITSQIFRHWKCGNSKVPVLAQPIINEIAGRDIFKDEDHGSNQQSETNHRNT